MKNQIRNIILEPKKHLDNLWQVISWPKVIGFLLVMIFFINIGIYIYDKKHPQNVDQFAIDNITSPYNSENSDIISPSQMFGMPSINQGGNGVAATPDTKGVFNAKTKGGDNLPPIARAKIVTTSITEGIFSGDTVFLSAVDSYDPDGSINEYRWDFDQQNGLGIDAEGSNATVKYFNPGIYTITLMVIDDKGLESTTTLTVSVQKKPEEKQSSIIAGLSTNKIDFDSLNFTSRLEIQNATESAFAEFQSTAYTNLSQTIYNSQRKKLPSLPSLSEIALVVGKDPSNTPPTIDSVTPREGIEVYDLKPIISAGFYGNNEINIDSIELLVDGKSVTPQTMKTKFGVQYKPSEELGYGEHQIMLVVTDERELKSTKSWYFSIVDPTTGDAELVPKYEDKEGPQVIMRYPDSNSKDIKTDSQIRISYDEPVITDSVEVAVVDLSTNITKFFTGQHIQWNATNTSLVINPNEDIFDYDHAYQIVVRQKDELKNESISEWYVLAEAYNAPDIKITYPKNNSSMNKPDLTVTGFVDSSNTVTVNDVVAIVDINGSFKANIKLERGENELLIVSKDLYGKQSTQTLVINYDPNANGGNPILDTQNSPVIMDASIKDGQVVTQVRPQISFVFADTDGIDTKSIVLKVDGEDVTSTSFIAKDSITYKPLNPLVQGQHTVQIIVADTKKNTTNYTMKFNVDAYPDNPSGLTASLTNNNKSVFLIWEGVSNIPNPEYRIFRSTSPNVSLATANEVKRGLTTTTWQDDTVIDGTTYYYVAVAVNKDGNLSNPSNEINIRVDSTAPVLRILEPEKNYVTEKNTIVMKGVTESNSTVQVYVNFVLAGTPTLNTDGSFEITLDLIPGDNIVTTISKDSDGNESVDVRTITYKVPDIDAPFPETRQPLGTDINVNTNIVVKYNEPMKSDTFKLTFKDKNNLDVVQPITLTNIALQQSEDKKTFTYNPPQDLAYLTTYTVNIYAEDLAGNSSINDDWEFITSDKLPPALQVVAPKENFYSEETTIEVSGKTEPNVDLIIRVSSTSGEGPTEYTLKSQADGFFAKLVSLYPYRQNVITIIATDHLGHTSMRVIQGTCNPPDRDKPLLVVNTPVQNAVVGGNTTTVNGITEPNTTLTITVNGEVQHDYKTNTADFTQNIRLQRGQNLIKVVSTDDSGNQSLVGITIYQDTDAPLLTIANPIDGLTTNQNTIEVRGITDRENSIVQINVNGTGFQNIVVLPDGSFSYWVNLAVGNNFIRVQALDNLNNRLEMIRTVYYDPVGGVSGAGIESQSLNENPQSLNGQSSSTQSSNTTGGTVNATASTDVINKPTGEMNYTGGDVTPPSNLNLNPANGTNTKNSSITISGSTEPEANVSIYQNGIYIYGGRSDINNGGFSTNTTLTEGNNVFISNSIDASGNKTSSASIFTLDTQGPNINILAPKINEIVKDNSLIVYGTTEPKTNLIVTLDSSSVQVISDEFGYFTATVTTSTEGLRNLTVIARDTLNNQTTKIIPITVDKTVPVLDLFHIETVASQPTVNLMIGNIVSTVPYGNEAFVSSTYSTLVGHTESNATIEVLSEGKTVSSLKATQGGDFRIGITAQSGRTSNIEVISTDIAGNKNHKYFKLRADAEAPILQIYSPSVNHDINSNSVTISGLVQDDTKPVTITVQLDDSMNIVSQTTTNANSFGGLTINGLSVGVHKLTVKAIDAIGNESFQVASIIVNPNADNPSSVDMTLAPDTTYTNINNALALTAGQINPTNFGAYGTYAAGTVPQAPAPTPFTPINLLDPNNGIQYRNRLVSQLNLLSSDFKDPSIIPPIIPSMPDSSDAISNTFNISMDSGGFSPNPPEYKSFNPSNYYITVPSNDYICSAKNINNIEIDSPSGGVVYPYPVSPSGGYIVKLRSYNSPGFGMLPVVKKSSEQMDSNGNYFYMYEGSFTLECLKF